LSDQGFFSFLSFLVLDLLTQEVKISPDDAFIAEEKGSTNSGTHFKTVYCSGALNSQLQILFTFYILKKIYKTANFAHHRKLNSIHPFVLLSLLEVNTRHSYYANDFMPR